MSEAMNAIRQTLESARARLLAERNSNGHWIGELSSSALSRPVWLSLKTKPWQCLWLSCSSTTQKGT